MHLLIGLGNLGLEYEATRHNFGFLLLDQIIEEYRFTKIGKKFSSEVFSGEISGHKIIALKPQTYMNNSGLAALPAMQFYKITPENIIAFHDEIDLAFGKIKVKLGGGNAGHNGLKSLDENIGKNYWRLRLGVGRPENKNFEIADYVLSKFTNEELEAVFAINKKISSLMPLLLANKSELFVNDFALESKK